MKQEVILSKLILHSSFNETIAEINRINILLPPSPTNLEMDFENYLFPPNGKLVTAIEEISKVKLNPKECEKLSLEDRPIVAYDESINKFSCLEGTAFFTSHSIILAGNNDFIPMNLLTLYFYTRSKEITEKSEFIKYSTDPEMDSQKDCIKDKINFLVNSVPKRSILFIDGPLIGGDVYTFMIHAIERFLGKDIIPIFFVKNSSSNLVTDNTSRLTYKFNSDMHWAYKFLTPGQRTNFFRYVDRNNPKNAKIFCYLKTFDLSPQRVEFHVGTYNKYKEIIPSLMDLIHYMILAQGNLKNPQVRQIAIAEKYARNTLKLVNINKMIRTTGITPTMNQERFGG